MAVRQATAYALRSRPLGEADLIVELFTRERGRIRAVARSARRLRSRFGSAFELFTRSRIVYFQRDKDELGRLSSCDLERSYFTSLSRLEHAVMAAYFAELILGFSPEHDPSPALFRLIGATMDALEEGTDPEALARYIEVWILRLSGFLPDLERCGACGRRLEERAWVSEASLELVCGRECEGQQARRRVSSGALELMRRILRVPPRALGTSRPAAAASLGAVMSVLLAGHLDRTPRALRVLERIGRSSTS